MSELKAYRPYANRDGFYHKSEVDAILAEKDKEIEELKEQVQEERSAKVNYKVSANDLSDGLKDAYEEIKHHKYKRCLAMTRWCHNQREIYERDSYDWELEDDAVNSLRNKANIMRKWRKRWLKIAEKFKEAK